MNLRPDTGDSRSAPCTQCGTRTPDYMFTDCCASPMCFDCREAHEWCAEKPVTLPARIELCYGALVIDVRWRQISVSGTLFPIAGSVSDVTARQFRELARAFEAAAEVSQ